MMNAMMSLNVKDYLKIYDNFLDQDLCKKIINEIETKSWEKHTFYRALNHDFISYEDDLSITYSESETAQLVHKKIWSAIEQYVIKDHSFMSEWYNGWSGYTLVRFNKYDVGTKMKIHCDHIHSMFEGPRKGIPTLSILGSLNDEY